MFSAALLLAASLVGAEPKEAFTSPKSPQPEYGFGLSAEEALAGWISLVDGRTTYGWKGAAVSKGVLSGGETTSPFGEIELRGVASQAGELEFGEPVKIAAGELSLKLKPAQASVIRLQGGLGLTKLAVRPVGLKSLFNGKDLTDCTVLPYSRLTADKQTKWTVENGALRGLGGPGAVELAGRYGNLVLQLEIRTRHTLVNGGVFVRAMPGAFMNGYESQVFNACYKNDPAQPAMYSTGAIDDRQLARRLVSRDEQPFLMTVVAHGPHLATWINGMQMVDWTDERAEHENPRVGRRETAGAIQLQAHDPETDVEFRRIGVAECK